MTYAKTLAWLDEVAKVGSKLGLSRTFELLNIMKNPQNRLKFVHIAGTNGKGSVAACIARVLYEAGYKTGLYTSPHLVKINERFNVDGADIEDDVFAELITGVREAALKMGEEASQFEILTAAAIIFKTAFLPVLSYAAADFKTDTSVNLKPFSIIHGVYAGTFRNNLSVYNTYADINLMTDEAGTIHIKNEDEFLQWS